jgi:hypothetical protein
MKNILTNLKKEFMNYKQKNREYGYSLNKVGTTWNTLILTTCKNGSEIAWFKYLTAFINTISGIHSHFKCLSQ